MLRPFWREGTIPLCTGIPKALTMLRGLNPAARFESHHHQNSQLIPGSNFRNGFDCYSMPLLVLQIQSMRAWRRKVSGNDTQNYGSSVQPPSQHTVCQIKTMMKSENQKVRTGVECSSYCWGSLFYLQCWGPIAKSHVFRPVLHRLAASSPVTLLL